MTIDVDRVPVPMSAPSAPRTPQDDNLTLERLYEVDPSGLWRRLASLPDQAARAWLLAMTASDLPTGEFDRIVVVGMGGSAIGAQLVAQVVQRRSAVTVTVVRDSQLPVLSDRTLLVLCSFSGDTDEVLTAFHDAVSGPASMVAITRGGALASAASEAGVPVVAYDCDGEPRSALGYGVMLLLGIINRLGFFPTSTEEIGDVFAALRSLGAEQMPVVPLLANPARCVARRIGDAIPVIVADASLAGAAVRWQNQCHENGKRWAFAGALPEVLHNFVEATGDGEDRGFHVLLLEDVLRPASARLRLDVLQAHLVSSRVPCSRLSFEGESDLSILLQACLLGDWVSYYLAIDAGIDPSPVPAISALKSQVAEHIAKSQLAAR